MTLGDNGTQYRCKVSNSFGTATSAQAILSVTSNQPPTATITAPASGTTYAGGDTINFVGTGTDPEDGTLPASAFTWWVDFHHDTHIHPFLPPTPGITSGSFVIPTIGETSPNVWYRIHLRVVDSATLTNETYRDVLPKTSTMSFRTSPAGLQLTLDGQVFTSPNDVVGVVGIIRTIGAPSPQGNNVFQSWSDGGAQTHTISTPASNTTYTATFTGGATPTPTFTRTNTPTATRTPTPGPTLTPTPTPTQLPLPGVSSVTPTSGSAAGGASVSIVGTNFLVVSTVSFGGQPASSTYVNPTHLNAVAPSLPAGTLNTVQVANGQSIGALANAWMADFIDVPQSSPYHGDVEKIFRNGITAGCGGGNFCASQSVKRSEMAVFLLKGKHGIAYVPPTCTGIFSDVQCTPVPAFAVNWIEALFNESITGGCAAGKYCPDAPTTRAQMAVLLLKAKHGSAYVPPPCTGIFSDVQCTPVPAFAVDWIEELSLEGITAGCGGGKYCPDQFLPRDQMATFLVRTFGLP